MGKSWPYDEDKDRDDRERDGGVILRRRLGREDFSASLGEINGTTGFSGGMGRTTNLTSRGGEKTNGGSCFNEDPRGGRIELDRLKST